MKKTFTRAWAPVVALLLILTSQKPVWAETFEHTKGEDHVFLSHVLAPVKGRLRQVQYRVYLPKNYDQNRKYGVVYFLHAKNGDSKMLDSLGFPKQMDALVDRGENPFIVVAPNGGNNYWMNGALTHEHWGEVIAHELIADVEKHFNVIGDVHARLVAGISMGGNGAFQLSLNYPDTYGALASHSPAFRTLLQTRKEFHEQYGNWINYTERDPVSLMKLRHHRLKGPLWVDIGARDIFLPRTTTFCNYLKTFSNLDAEFHVAEDLEGRHEMAYWEKHLPEYIRWYGHHLSQVHY